MRPHRARRVGIERFRTRTAGLQLTRCSHRTIISSSADVGPLLVQCRVASFALPQRMGRHNSAFAAEGSGQRMRTSRSRLLTVLVLLTLAGLCTWSKSEAGSLLSRNSGTAGAGSPVLVPGAQPTSGDPDSPTTSGSSVITHESDAVASATSGWSGVWAGWARWGWVWLRYVGH